MSRRSSRSGGHSATGHPRSVRYRMAGASDWTPRSIPTTASSHSRRTAGSTRPGTRRRERFTIVHPGRVLGAACRTPGRLGAPGRGAGPALQGPARHTRGLEEFSQAQLHGRRLSRPALVLLGPGRSAAEDPEGCWNEHAWHNGRSRRDAPLSPHTRALFFLLSSPAVRRERWRREGAPAWLHKNGDGRRRRLTEDTSPRRAGG